MNLADAYAARVAAIEAEAMPTLGRDELLMLAGMEARDELWADARLVATTAPARAFSEPAA